MQQYTVKPPPRPAHTGDKVPVEPPVAITVPVVPPGITNAPVTPPITTKTTATHTTPIKAQDHPPVTSKRVGMAQNQAPPATSKRVETTQVHPPASLKHAETVQETRHAPIQLAAKTKEPLVNPWIGREGSGHNQVWPANTETPPGVQIEAVRTRTGQAETILQTQRTPPMTRGTRVSDNQDSTLAKEVIQHHEPFNANARAKQVKWHGEIATEVENKQPADAPPQHPQDATVSNTAAIKSAPNAVLQSNEEKTGDSAREPTPVMVYYAQLAHLILPVHFDSCASHNFIGTRDLWNKLQSAGIVPGNCPPFGVAQGSTLPPVTQYMILPFTCIDDSGNLQHAKQALFYYCPVGATVLISKRQANQANILRYSPPPQYLETLLQHQNENQQPTVFYTSVVVDFAVQVDTCTENSNTETSTYIQIDVQTSIQDTNTDGQAAEEDNTIEITSHTVTSDGTCVFRATAEGMKHFVDQHQKTLQGRRDKGELADILQRATPQQLRGAACDLIYKYQNEKVTNLGGRTPREYITKKYIEGNKPLTSVNGPYTNTASSLETSEEPLIRISSVHDYLIVMRKASTKGDTLCVAMLVEYVGIRIIILKQRIGHKHLSVQADMRPTDIQKRIHCAGNNALHLAGSGTYTVTKHLMLLRDDKSVQWAHLSAEDSCKHLDCAPIHRALRVSRTVLTNAFRYGTPEKGEEDDTEDTFRKDMMGRCLFSLGSTEDIEPRGELVSGAANQTNPTNPEAANINLGSNPDHVPEELQGPIQQTEPP